MVQTWRARRAAELTMKYADRHSVPKQTPNRCLIVSCVQSLVNVYQNVESAVLRFTFHGLQWWEKAKGAPHRVKYPFSSGLAPRAGLEPATSRLQVPQFFNRAWTISSPTCRTIQGRVSGAVEALLDGFRSL